MHRSGTQLAKPPALRRLAKNLRFQISEPEGGKARRQGRLCSITACHWGLNSLCSQGQRGKETEKAKEEEKEGNKRKEKKGK